MADSKGTRSIERTAGLGTDVGNDVAAIKDPRQRIIIGGRNRIELVVVAAGASDRQTQKRARRDIELIVDNVGQHLFFVGIAVAPRPDRQKSGRNRSFDIQPIGRGGLDQVARELVDDETVVGEIAVHCPNDPIAVSPGIFDVAERRILCQIARIATVGIPGNVEPVPTPSLAILGRGQQSIDHFGKRIGRRIRQKGLHLGRGRRQTGKIETRSTNQRPSIGRRGMPQVGLLELGKDVAVDFRAAARRFLRSRAAGTTFTG